jgi:hypothetical protein
MNLDDLIKLQALKLRHTSANGHLLEEAIRQNPDKMRNLQAAVSIELFDAVEHVCTMLDLTKRQFIEAAVVDAVNKAEAAIREVGDHLADARADAQAGGR